MKASHTPAAVSAAFDDPNLIAHAGLVPVMRLAERCGLSRLVTQKVKLTGTTNGAGASVDAKVTSIVAGVPKKRTGLDGPYWPTTRLICPPHWSGRQQPGTPV
jgi:hypothetical protein